MRTRLSLVLGVSGALVLAASLVSGQSRARVSPSPVPEDGSDGLALTGNPCALGTVNSGAGATTDVLFINGSTCVVTVAVSTPITIALNAAPGGPSPALYAVYAWNGMPSNSLPLVVLGSNLGCTVNSTPLQLGLPQPFTCRRALGIPPIACSSPPGPTSAPWTITILGGIANPITITIQAVLRDNGANNALNFSVTNAVVLVVQ